MIMLLNTTHLAVIDRYDIPATSLCFFFGASTLQKKAQAPLKTVIKWFQVLINDVLLVITHLLQPFLGVITTTDPN